VGDKVTEKVKPHSYTPTDNVPWVIIERSNPSGGRARLVYEENRGANYARIEYHLLIMEMELQLLFVHSIQDKMGQKVGYLSILAATKM